MELATDMNISILNYMQRGKRKQTKTNCILYGAGKTPENGNKSVWEMDGKKERRQSER